MELLSVNPHKKDEKLMKVIPVLSRVMSNNVNTFIRISYVSDG